MKRTFFSKNTKGSQEYFPQQLLMVLFSSSFILPRNPPCEFLRGVRVNCHSCVAISPGWFDTSIKPPNTGQHTQTQHYYIHSLPLSLSMTDKHSPGFHSSTEEMHSHKQSKTLVRTCVKKTCKHTLTQFGPQECRRLVGVIHIYTHSYLGLTC